MNEIQFEEVSPSQTGPLLFAVQDVSTEQISTGLTPGGMAVLAGKNIRIENGHIRLRNTATGAEEVIAGNLAENTVGKVIFLVPAALAAGTYRLSPWTCCNGSRPYTEPGIAGPGDCSLPSRTVLKESLMPRLW